jgi:hypothetical protein
MFVVTEADAAAIRAVYQQRGELSAAVELRRRFPGITDNAQARMPGPSLDGSRRRRCRCVGARRQPPVMALPDAQNEPACRVTSPQTQRDGPDTTGRLRRLRSV